MDYEQLGLTLPESTSLWADRPASVRPLLESVLELLTRATAGPNIYGSFAKLSPDGSWLKIALGCSQLTMDGSLEIFSGVWPRRATMFAGIVGEPPTSERRTSGTGFSSSDAWPTPTVEDNGRNGSAEMARRWANGESIPTCHQRLRTAILWPTPTATEGTHGGPNQRDSSGRPGLTASVKQMWPTPTTPNGGRSVAHVDDWRSDTTAYHNGKKVQVDLNAAVKMWPTPRTNGATGPCDHGQGGKDLQTAVMWPSPKSRDYKDATCEGTQGRQSPDLGKVVGQSADAGALSPDWVETLQGYEPGWTKLPDGWKNKGGQQEKAPRNMTGSRQE